MQSSVRTTAKIGRRVLRCSTIMGLRASHLSLSDAMWDANDTAAGSTYQHHHVINTATGRSMHYIISSLLLSSLQKNALALVAVYAMSRDDEMVLQRSSSRSRACNVS